MAAGLVGFGIVLAAALPAQAETRHFYYDANAVSYENKISGNHVSVGARNLTGYGGIVATARIRTHTPDGGLWVQATANGATAVVSHASKNVYASCAHLPVNGVTEIVHMLCSYVTA